MTNNSAERKPRELEERNATTRGSNTFVPPGVLPEFNRDPNYAYRWIRASTWGQSDNPNVNARFREGWVPVDASEHPEIIQFAPDEKYKDMVEHGGLILCKMSKEKAKARDDYYRKIAAQQLSTVDNDMFREEDPRMPVFKNRKTTVTRGRNES